MVEVVETMKEVQRRKMAALHGAADVGVICCTRGCGDDVLVFGVY